MTLCTFLGIWCAVLSGPAVAIDGDTLIVRGTHVRLWGIDAEELHEMHGYDAKNALAELIRGREVDCHDSGQRSYGRVVARCLVPFTLNGDRGPIDISRDLGQLMVNQGYALDCARYSGSAYRSAEPLGARVRLKQKPYC